MTSTAQRTVLFADLRGSTGLYERIGNTPATRFVIASVDCLCAAVTACRGTVTKTLGDGLMAIFGEPADALLAAGQMHDALEHLGLATKGRDHVIEHPALKLQVALATTRGCRACMHASTGMAARSN